MNMKSFEVLHLDIPKRFEGSYFTAIRHFQVKHLHIFVAWRGKKVLISQSSSGTVVNHFEVLTLEHEVKDVLQLTDNLCCLTSNGLLYKFHRSDKRAERLQSPVNMFDSSSDQEMGPTEVVNETFTFKEMASFPGVICVAPIHHGLILVKEYKGKLYLEAFKISATLDRVNKIKSVMLNHVNVEVMPSCVITSVGDKDLAPDLIATLIDDLVLTDIYFIGLGSGQAYCVPVSIKDGTVGSPRLIYNSVQPISGIMCFSESASPLGSHISIVLETGPVINISLNKTQKQICYDTTYLPGSVHCLCQVGSYFLTSDGQDLWQCRLQRNEVEELWLESKTVGVKGVHSICSTSEASDQALVSTFHGSFYLIHLGGEQSSASKPAKRDDLPNTSVSIMKQLQHLASLRQEIAREDELIAGVSVALRAELLKDSFTLGVKVWDWHTAIASTHFDQHTLISLLESIGGREGLRNSSLRDRYVLEIDIENRSEQDFPSSMWSVNTSVVSDFVTTKKTERLKSPFKKGTTFHNVISVNIPNPVSTVEITCMLVSELPNCKELPSTLNRGAQWLTIPIANKVLDVTYFLTPLLGADQAVSGSDNMYKDYNTLLMEIRESNKDVSVSTSTENKRSWLVTKEMKYSCTLRIPDEINHQIWRAVFENCWHRCSKEIQTWCQSGEGNTAQSLTITVGPHPVQLTLVGSSVELYCGDVPTLHAVKNVLLFRLEAIAGTSHVIVNVDTLKRALALQERINIEAAEPDIENLKIFHKDWRESVVSTLPS